MNEAFPVVLYNLMSIPIDPYPAYSYIMYVFSDVSTPFIRCKITTIVDKNKILSSFFQSILFLQRQESCNVFYDELLGTLKTNVVFYW